ncbi:MAG: diguanylate cyclase [Collimonas sp.]|uniref:sensor domain-containing diguanylate cyclase n=1 Tax=Collimonas sp. TaxID=1963772 RepID=UPI00326451F8
MGKQLIRQIQRLEFLRDSVRTILLWILACLLLISAVWWIELAKVNGDRAEIEKNTLTKATRLSKSYAEQLSRSVEQIDQITRNLKYQWQTMHGSLKLEQQLQQGLYPWSAQLYATVVDRNGTIVTSTLDKSAFPNIADRDFFKAQKMNLANSLLINKPSVGRRSGKTVIRFTRRLETADGGFDGIVVVAVEPAFLATDESSLGMNDCLSIRDTNGVVLAAKMGERIRTLPFIFQSPPVFDSPSGVVRMAKEKFTDRQPRAVAWQKLGSYPLVASATISEADALAAYQPSADNYRNLAIAKSVFLSLLGISGVFLLSRLAWRKRQADEVKNTYRLAIDGAHEGFYMVLALYDQQHNVVDFMVKDCNERGAFLVGYAKEELVGKQFSELYSGKAAHHVFIIFRSAMETGFYEDEFKVSHIGPRHATWMSRRLVRSGRGLAMSVRDISESKAYEQALLSMANTDALTALPNRHWLMTFLPAALNQARSRGTIFALLFIDLDKFKAINDTSGHQAGDELLQEAARRLKSVLRPEDRVVRLGGDEFTVLLDSVNGPEEVAHVAARINQEFHAPFEIGGRRDVVSASIGITLFPSDGNDAATLLKNADIAMYSAKAEGAGQFRFYDQQLGERLEPSMGVEKKR